MGLGRPVQGAALPAPKPAIVSHAIQASGAESTVLSLWSMRRDPMAMVGARLGAWLTKIAARTIDELRNAVGTSSRQLIPGDRENDGKAAGHALERAGMAQRRRAAGPPVAPTPGRR